MRISLLHYANPEFPQLCGRHRCRRFHHQILSGGSLGEGNYFAQAVRSRENHHNAIKSKRDAAVRRRSIFERLEKKAEAQTRFFVCHPESVKDFALHILPMNTDRSRSKLCPIQDDIIGKRANHRWISLKLFHIFIVRRSEGMVRSVPASPRLIPLE